MPPILVAVWGVIYTEVEHGEHSPESWRPHGKVSNTEEFALSTDLKTLTMTVHIVGRDKTYVLMFERK